jgi:hypothetical protein
MGAAEALEPTAAVGRCRDQHTLLDLGDGDDALLAARWLHGHQRTSSKDLV